MQQSIITIQKFNKQIPLIGLQSPNQEQTVQK